MTPSLESMPPDWRKDFGARLRRYREISGLTQREAAEQLGVQATHWNHWERGRRVPSIHRLPAIARILSTPIAALLEDDFDDRRETAEWWLDPNGTGHAVLRVMEHRISICFREDVSESDGWTQRKDKEAPARVCWKCRKALANRSWIIQRERELPRE